MALRCRVFVAVGASMGLRHGLRTSFESFGGGHRDSLDIGILDEPILRGGFRYRSFVATSDGAPLKRLHMSRLLPRRERLFPDTLDDLVGVRAIWELTNLLSAHFFSCYGIPCNSAASNSRINLSFNSSFVGRLFLFWHSASPVYFDRHYGDKNRLVVGRARNSVCVSSRRLVA
jgi:hypothetical protein